MEVYLERLLKEGKLSATQHPVLKALLVALAENSIDYEIEYCDASEIDVILPNSTFCTLEKQDISVTKIYSPNECVERYLFDADNLDAIMTHVQDRINDNRRGCICSSETSKSTALPTTINKTSS